MINKKHLQDFKISLRDLERENPKMIIHIHLKYPDHKDLVEYAPKERLKRIHSTLRQDFKKLKKSFSGKIKRIGKKDHPIGLTLKTTYRSLKETKSSHHINYISIDQIEGYKRKKVKVQKSFFCVKTRILIQVEGLQKGKQSYEDRFLLVKAKSFEEAEKKAIKELKAYAQPYLNPVGRLVRWKFKEVMDIYDTGILDKDLFRKEATQEVFSSIKSKKMKPAHIWQKQWKE